MLFKFFRVFLLIQYLIEFLKGETCKIRGSSLVMPSLGESPYRHLDTQIVSIMQELAYTGLYSLFRFESGQPFQFAPVKIDSGAIRTNVDLDTPDVPWSAGVCHTWDR